MLLFLKLKYVDFNEFDIWICELVFHHYRGNCYMYLYMYYKVFFMPLFYIINFLN